MQNHCIAHRAATVQQQAELSDLVKGGMTFNKESNHHPSKNLQTKV